MINNRKLLTQGNAVFILSALFLIPLYWSSAFASSGGTITSGTSCSICHSGGTTGSLLITGPDTVAPHSVNTFTLSITGGPGIVGGLNVYAPEGGILSILDAGTQLVGDEITHTAPKPFSGGTVSWDFQWQAPAVVGALNIFAQGVSANDADGPGGDWAGLTSFAIQVVPVPAAVFLFGSALGLLGWMRRRAA